MEERSLEEALIDRLLLLYVVARTRQKGYNIVGNIKLQKMLYKTQERMYLAKCKGLNFNFVRWRFGPFSQEIYSDIKDLKATGYLIPEDVASASEKGIKLLRNFDSIFDDETKDIIERVINEFGPYSGRQIREVMYSYPKVGEKKTIEEAELGEVLLTRLKPENARKCVRIDEEKLETLRFLFDPKSNAAIQDGIRSLKTEECKPFIPVRHRQGQQ
jgi:uncharacterized phage-associated protein